MLNPYNADTESRLTVAIGDRYTMIDVETGRSMHAPAKLYVHHVRLMHNAGFKVYLHCWKQPILPRYSGWFTLHAPSRHQELMEAMDMPHRRVSAKHEIFNTNDSSYVLLTFERDNGVKESFDFRPCSTQNGDEMLDCLRCFIPTYETEDFSPEISPTEERPHTPIEDGEDVFHYFSEEHLGREYEDDFELFQVPCGEFICAFSECIID